MCFILWENITANIEANKCLCRKKKEEQKKNERNHSRNGIEIGKMMNNFLGGYDLQNVSVRIRPQYG